jgi:type IX secretion system PorP/SprF family membrane protein
MLLRRDDTHICMQMFSMQDLLMKMFILLLIVMICPSRSSAQDIHFSQFFETPLLRNPALAGLFNGDLRIQTVFRSQWNSVTVPYVTGSLNGEYKLPVGRSDDFITVGGQILYDKAGSTNFTAVHVLPVFNYHKSINGERNMYLSAGLMGGLVQRRLDPTKVTTDNQFNGSGFDPNLSTGETFNKTGYSYFDLSAGISFNSQIGASEDNNLFVGVGIHHVSRSKVGFYDVRKIAVPLKLVYSAGLRMGVTDYSYLTFHADHAQQQSNTETIGGMLYSLKLDDPEQPKYVIHGGGFLRWKDAAIPVLKLDYEPFSVAVSYDINMSQLKSASQGRGGLEFSLNYITYFNRYYSSKNAIHCPRF